MMKLHRPLCSDVTLRLTADLSPDDDEEDVMSSLNKLNEDSCSCCVGSINDNGNKTDTTAERRNHRPHHYSRQYSDQNDNHFVSNHSNHKHGRTNSLNHNHKCTWYSRQNTDDKTAKDIYNQEHLLHHEMNSTSDFKNISLDSEFKRSFEEGGNDFKEVSLSQELSQNGFPGNQRMDVVNKKQQVLTKLETMYIDAKLSYLKDTARFQSIHKLQDDEEDDNDDDDDDGSEEADFTLKRKRHVSGDTDGTSTTYDDDDDEEMNKKDTDEEDEAHPGMDTDFSDDFDEDVLPSTVPELPVDLDEDVEMVSKQLMSDSMIESFYGEVDESLLQASMTKSIQEEIEPIPDEMSKSIAEEIHDVLVCDDPSKEILSASPETERLKKQLPFPYPFTMKHAGHLFDKSRHYFTAASPKPKSRERTVSSTSQSTVDTTTSSVNDSSSSCHDTPPANDTSLCVTSTNDISAPSSPLHVKANASKNEASQPTIRQKCSVATMTMVQSLDLEVTHRGLHRFVPRHKDEINIGIGDPIHVLKECDDLWCEGINLRTGEKGIFPAVYANDLTFLEESDDDEEYWKFSMRFLGSVEVSSHKGDETLVQAINKVAMSHKGNVRAAACSSLEISQYGIRMIDKSKEGHEKDAFSHFFALKNISFCGTHPKNNRYFAFITKHPREHRFACHVFYGDSPTHRARDALGEAFKRFYQEYMAFTHPTEDIYIE